MTADNTPAFGHEVEAGARDALPAYAPMLAALHCACADELQRIVGVLPLHGGEHVLDIACGDGVYSVWLAEQVGATGAVVGVDLAPVYLDMARRHASHSNVAARITFEAGDIDALPFPDDHFDLAWCAHSLPDPVVVLRELRRVVRPGGTVAILENDTLHHMLLPWPPQLELAVRQAQLDALEAATSMTGKFYVGRNLLTLFDTVGLMNCLMTTYTIDHHAPLSADERTYLEGYLDDIRERTYAHLMPEGQQAWDMLLDPKSELYLLDRPDFFASHLEIVARGTK